MAEFQACADLLEGLEAGKALRGQVIAMIGNVHTLMGNINKGVKSWQIAVKLNPTLIDTHQNIIKANADQGRNAEALKHAQTALKLHPTNVNFLVSVGDSCKAMRNFTCAKNSYHRALELEPDDYVATFSLAVAHRDLMELNEAIPLFEKAGKINPGQAATINALAVVRGDTCLWGVPDYSDPSFTEKAGNIFIKTAKNGPPERQSPIHPLLVAYYLDDPQLLKLVVASHATMAEREAAVYVGRGSIDRCQYLFFCTSTASTFVLILLARCSRAVRQIHEPARHRRQSRQVLRLGQSAASAPPLATAARSVPDCRHPRPPHRASHPRHVSAAEDGRAHRYSVYLLYWYRSTNTDALLLEVYMYSYGPNDHSMYRSLIRAECEHFKDRERVPYLEVAFVLNQKSLSRA